jgi:GTP-binding protein
MSPPVQDTLAEESLAEHLTFRPVARTGFTIERIGPTSFAVRGDGVERLLARHDPDNEEAMAHMEGRLRRMGVIRALDTHGFQPGDDIEIGGVIFELDPRDPSR